MSDDRTTTTTTSSARETSRGETARQRALDAYSSARESVAGARRRASDNFSEAPLIALAGGIAAGALIAALLPRTESETRLIKPTAKRVREGARAAVQAARDTGSERLDELGLTRDKGEETVRALLRDVTEAARASVESALDAARDKRDR
jgi:hypothetical protein